MSPQSRVNNICIYCYKPRTQRLIVQTHDICLTQRLCEMFVYNQAHYPEEEEEQYSTVMCVQFSSDSSVQTPGADDCTGCVPGLVWLNTWPILPGVKINDLDYSLSV